MKNTIIILIEHYNTGSAHKFVLLVAQVLGARSRDYKHLKHHFVVFLRNKTVSPEVLTAFLLQALNAALHPTSSEGPSLAAANFVVDLFPTIDGDVPLPPATLASLVDQFWALLPPGTPQVDPTTLSSEARARLHLALKLVQVTHLTLGHVTVGCSTPELLAMPGTCNDCMHLMTRDLPPPDPNPAPNSQRHVSDILTLTTTLLGNRSTQALAVQFPLRFPQLAGLVDSPLMMQAMVVNGQEAQLQRWGAKLCPVHQRAGIGKALEAGRHKAAHTCALKWGLDQEVKFVRPMLKVSTLDRLVGRQQWAVAAAYAGTDKALQQRFLSSIVEAGLHQLAIELGHQYAFDPALLPAAPPPAHVPDQRDPGQQYYTPGAHYHAPEMVDTAESLQEATAYLCQQEVVALDVEWRPIGSRQPALLQLAGGHRTFLLDLHVLPGLTGFSENLGHVLRPGTDVIPQDEGAEDGGEAPGLRIPVSQPVGVESKQASPGVVSGMGGYREATASDCGASCADRGEAAQYDGGDVDTVRPMHSKVSIGRIGSGGSRVAGVGESENVAVQPGAQPGLPASRKLPDGRDTRQRSLQLQREGAAGMLCEGEEAAGRAARGGSQDGKEAVRDTGGVSNTPVLVGCGLTGDLHLLASTWPQHTCFQHVGPVLDLQLLFQRWVGETGGMLPTSQPVVGLSTIAAAVLGAPLDKAMQASNWDLRPLTSRQVAYAQADVTVLLDLHAAMLAAIPREAAAQALTWYTPGTHVPKVRKGRARPRPVRVVWSGADVSTDVSRELAGGSSPGGSSQEDAQGPAWTENEDTQAGGGALLDAGTIRESRSAPPGSDFTSGDAGRGAFARRASLPFGTTGNEGSRVGKLPSSSTEAKRELGSWRTRGRGKARSRLGATEAHAIAAHVRGRGGDPEGTDSNGALGGVEGRAGGRMGSPRWQAQIPSLGAHAEAVTVPTRAEEGDEEQQAVVLERVGREVVHPAVWEKAVEHGLQGRFFRVAGSCNGGDPQGGQGGPHPGNGGAVGHVQHVKGQPRQQSPARRVVPPKRCIKTLLFRARGEAVALVLRGDWRVDNAKLRQMLALNQRHIKKASEDDCAHNLGFVPGCVPPCGFLESARTYVEAGLLPQLLTCGKDNVAETEQEGSGQANPPGDQRVGRQQQMVSEFQKQSVNKKLQQEVEQFQQSVDMQPQSVDQRQQNVNQYQQDMKQQQVGELEQPRPECLQYCGEQQQQRVENPLYGAKEQKQQVDKSHRRVESQQHEVEHFQTSVAHQQQSPGQLLQPWVQCKQQDAMQRQLSMRSLQESGGQPQILSVEWQHQDVEKQQQNGGQQLRVEQQRQVECQHGRFQQETPAATWSCETPGPLTEPHVHSRFVDIDQLPGNWLLAGSGYRGTLWALTPEEVVTMGAAQVAPFAVDSVGRAEGASPDQTPSAPPDGTVPGEAEQATPPAPTANGDATGNTVRFTLDSMLGRLRRWLRCLGIDTEYLATSYPPSELARVARAATSAGRVFLTRSLALASSRDAGAVFLLKSDIPSEQLAELVAHFGLRFDPSAVMSRCSRCNAKQFRLLSPEEKVGKVPPRIRERVERMWVCEQCGCVFWVGPKSRSAARMIQQQLGLQGGLPPELQWAEDVPQQLQ